MEKHIASDCQNVDEAAKQVERPPTSPQDVAFAHLPVPAIVCSQRATDKVMQ